MATIGEKLGMPPPGPEVEAHLLAVRIRLAAPTPPQCPACADLGVILIPPARPGTGRYSFKACACRRPPSGN